MRKFNFTKQFAALVRYAAKHNQIFTTDYEDIWVKVIPFPWHPENQAESDREFRKHYDEINWSK